MNSVLQATFWKQSTLYKVIDTGRLPLANPAAHMNQFPLRRVELLMDIITLLYSESEVVVKLELPKCKRIEKIDLCGAFLWFFVTQCDTAYLKFLSGHIQTPKVDKLGQHTI